MAHDGAGWSVSGAGDVNGDGYDDMVIGAYFNSDAGLNTGAAYLVLGGATPASASLSTAIEYTGVTDLDWAGSSVSGAGDVNADGYDDFLVGINKQHYDSDGIGHVYLVLGGPSPTGGSLGDEVEYQGFQYEYLFMGLTVAGAGDFDGDGFDDMLLSSYGQAGGAGTGAVYLELGSATPTSTVVRSPIEFTGEAGYDQAGTALSTAGDFDGDGLDDFIAGAWGSDEAASEAGCAYVVLGEVGPAGGDLRATVQYLGETSNDAAGFSVGGGGDVNGDGYSDVIVGAPGVSGDVNKVHLLLGSSAPTSGRVSDGIAYTGGAADDGVGLSVSGPEDIDGDGYADLVVGAPGDQAAGLHSGAAYLVFGLASPTPLDWSATVKFAGAEVGEQAGAQVAAPGDVDGDGHGDILVGAGWGDDGGVGAGQTYLILGTGL